MQGERLIAAFLDFAWQHSVEVVYYDIHAVHESGVASLLLLQDEKTDRQMRRVAPVDRIQRGEHGGWRFTQGKQRAFSLNVNKQAIAGIMLTLKIEIKACFAADSLLSGQMFLKIKRQSLIGYCGDHSKIRDATTCLQDSRQQNWVWRGNDLFSQRAGRCNFADDGESFFFGICINIGDRID